MPEVFVKGIKNMSNTLLCPNRNEICQCLLVTNCRKMIGVSEPEQQIIQAQPSWLNVSSVVSKGLAGTQIFGETLL